ncbi:MAG: hypothetical protein MUO23_05685 [Anaerolineales bacterium]|nr:hypothetical protein [Anaerolineales bacterium]
MKSAVRIVLWLGVLAPLWFSAQGAAAPDADAAQEILERMSPVERVGQLFLVTFEGSEIPLDSPILRLIEEGRVGGVVLRKANGNFSDGESSWSRVAELTSSLQAAALGASEAGGTPGLETAEPGSGPYIPLWVGISPGLDGTLSSELLGIASESATPMALGGAWDPALARESGQQAGRELASLGINLAFAPSVDIVENVQPGGAEALGVQSLGGDPFWVGRLGRAFVAGLRQGAEGRVAVVATHFPGMGNADRPAEEEVATVRKSLEQLRQTELAPFLALAAPPTDNSDRGVDGLLVSHIRYQGLQGNIRETTRPVSLDRDALSQLVAIEPIAEWRANGGLMVSESLGARAIRRFVDPREQTFNGVVVARTAFQAGLDLLLLQDFQNPEDADELTSILNTLRSFADKYEDDPVFAEQVDAAVLRLLRKKLELYGGSFEAGIGAPAEAGEAQPPAGSENPLAVARRSATLISPSPEEVRERLGVPETGDRIVFFTDVRRDQACATCASVPILGTEALAESVNTLYGTASGGQVRSWDLESFTLADLAVFLGEKPPTSPAEPIRSADEVGRAISGADWLIFAVLRTTPDVFGSDALQLMLDRRPDLLGGKRAVVFAMDVPFDLDSTDISKIDALYGLYGHTPAFVDTAARLLFQEVAPTGRSPVSIPGVGYDLLSVLTPDPDQLIRIGLRSPDVPEGEATVEPGFLSGDQIVLEAGPILDWNGNRVPDGTPVEFMLQYQDETIPSTVGATTVEGMASGNVLLDRIGVLSIQARSEPARASEIVQLNVQEGAPAFVTVIAPTPVPSETSAVAASGSAVPPTAAESISANPQADQPQPAGLDSFLGAALGCVGVGLAGWRLLRRRWPYPLLQARVGLVAVIGGMAAYVYLVLQMPGSPGAAGAEGVFVSFVFAAAGAGAGLAALWGLEARRSVGGGQTTSASEPPADQEA